MSFHDTDIDEVLRLSNEELKKGWEVKCPETTRTSSWPSSGWSEEKWRGVGPGILRTFATDSALRNKPQLINMVNRYCEIYPTVSHLRVFLEFITFILAGSCCSRFSRCYDDVNKWIKHLLCVFLSGSFSYIYSRLHIIYHCTNNCNSIPARHVQYI